MALRGGALVDHVNIRIVSTYTDLAIGRVDIPVTTIGHGSIRIEGLAIFLFPCYCGVVTCTVNKPESTYGSKGFETLSCLYRVVKCITSAIPSVSVRLWNEKFAE